MGQRVVHASKDGKHTEAHRLKIKHGRARKLEEKRSVREPHRVLFAATIKSRALLARRMRLRSSRLSSPTASAHSSVLGRRPSSSSSSSRSRSYSSPAMIIFDSCCSCSLSSNRVDEMELKYQEMSCPPPRRVTAVDLVRGRVATAMEGKDALMCGAEEGAAAAVGGQTGVSSAPLKAGASGRQRSVGALPRNPNIAAVSDNMTRRRRKGSLNDGDLRQFAVEERVVPPPKLSSRESSALN